jgi:hypothetical protein
MGCISGGRRSDGRRRGRGSAASRFCAPRRVRSTPLLRSHNRYSTLSVDTLDNTDISDCDTDVRKPPTTPVTARNPPLAPRARWEKRLPSKYIVASIPSANSLEVEVQIQGTDIGAPVSLNALLDCGATGIFMDTEWACKNKITT